MKPDIVFFGESLPQKFHRHMAIDKSDVDLLIVIGSSLKVRPVALIPCKYTTQLSILYQNFGTCIVQWMKRIQMKNEIFVVT